MFSIHPLTAILVCVLLVALPSLTVAQGEYIPANQVCTSTDAVFVGPCFNFRARLQHGADNIIIWIWRVGTKRMLGYADGALRCTLPDNIDSVITTAKTIYADIVVRPVSRAQPGHMQFVCIASATKLIVRDQPL